MCLCECTMLSCLSISLIMLNPGDDTLNPVCQPGPLQRHSGEELGLALAHSLHSHTHTHTCLSSNTKAGHKEKKAFLLSKISKQLSHLYMCVWECEKGQREQEQQGKKEKEGKTPTRTHTSDTKKEEIKQHFLCLETQNCHKGTMQIEYKEAYTDHWTATQFKTHKKRCIAIHYPVASPLLLPSFPYSLHSSVPISFRIKGNPRNVHKTSFTSC